VSTTVSVKSEHLLRSFTPRTLTAIIATFAFFLFFSVNAAFAFAATTDPLAPSAPSNITQLTPQYVAGLVGSLIPIIVSLLARSNANTGVKVTLNLVLTAAAGAISALVVVDPSTGVATFGVVPFLTAWLFAFIASTVSYLGILKNLNLNTLLLSLGGVFGDKLPPEVEVAPQAPEPSTEDVKQFIADEYPTQGE
jgi:hypothetical protein